MHLETVQRGHSAIRSREHRFTDFVMGPTIMGRRNVFTEHPFQPVTVGEDTGFLRDVRGAGKTIYSADRFNYFQVRTGNGHTWQVDDAELLASGDLKFYGKLNGSCRHLETAETAPPITTVAVVGLGYIGLPTAAILATNGLDVIGVDVNPRTVDAVNNGDVPFVEPDLGVHVAGAVSQGRLRAQLETPAADAYIVAVPTPFQADKSADMSYIAAAARAIAPQLRGGELVILESTSPPGSTRRLAELILGLRPDLSLDGADGKPVLLVAHCPERVLPGRIMIELVTNDRVVGGLTTEAAEAAAALYGVFCQGEIHLTDAATAEMSKLVENAYRDVNIAFANELSVISDNLDIDVWELIRLANHHPRVNILQPGPGVGGHCIAVDPWFIVAADPENSSLIRTAREVNDSKPGYVVDQVREGRQRHRPSGDRLPGPRVQSQHRRRPRVSGAGDRPDAWLSCIRMPKFLWRPRTRTTCQRCWPRIPTSVTSRRTKRLRPPM